MRNFLPGLLALSVVCVRTGGVVEADELRLSKAVVEGRVIEESNQFIRIETVSGVLTVPLNAVSRRIRGPSRLERYAEQREREPLTPARHLELAAWCRSVDLDSLARDHVDAALADDPQNPDALRAAGYVRLGDIWLAAGPSTPKDTADDKAPAVVDELLAGWHKYVRSIRERHFSGGADTRAFAKGQVQLLLLREPLVIPAACRVLGDGDNRARLVLAEVLGSYGQDAASLNLLAMALLDASPEVRQAANAQLTRRGDRRIRLFLRQALRCELETILQRAAESLARLGDTSAVDDLITVLPTTGLLGRQVSANELFDQVQAMFTQAMLVAVGNEPFEYPSSIAVPSFRRRIAAVEAQDQVPTGAFRSYVQDALIMITGENYGFDLAAWRDWATRHAPNNRTAP